MFQAKVECWNFVTPAMNLKFLQKLGISWHTKQLRIFFQERQCVMKQTSWLVDWLVEWLHSQLSQQFLKSQISLMETMHEATCEIGLESVWNASSSGFSWPMKLRYTPRYACSWTIRTHSIFKGDTTRHVVPKLALVFLCSLTFLTWNHRLTACEQRTD
jgi:hypothetical protein